MYDSDYDRQIVKQVEDINRRFIAHQRAVGRARMVNDCVNCGAGLAGGSFLDKIPVVGNIASMFGLGDTGAGVTGGRRKKLGRAITGSADLEGGSFLDKIPVVGNIASMFGLGETGAGRKKRVYKKKGGAELLNMVEKNGGNLGLFGLGETGAGRKKRVYKKKGGADLEGGRRKKLGRAITGSADLEGGRRKKLGRAITGSADLEGGSFLDNIPVVGNIASMFGLGDTGAGVTGGRKKKVQRKGKGVEDALEGGYGSKKGAKKNPWISHVKAVAAKKGISYREALKIAKASY